jgi:biotin transport system substrate-specific component
MATTTHQQVSSVTSLIGLNETLTGKLALAVAASLFVAVCAHLTVPLPFTPVPLTLSDLAVLLVGLSLGPVTGFAALALYLLEGAMGAPVFNPAGPGGIAQLFGPTGGYLIAYPFAAAAAGGLFSLFSKRTTAPKFLAAIAAATVGSALVMCSGVSWLGTVLHLAPATAFKMGALPFLPGQIVKVFASAGIVMSIQRLRGN